MHRPSQEEKARLAAILPKLEDSTADIVIICPRGLGSAIRTVDYYRAKGVNPNRMFILEKGISQWPYETEKKTHPE